MSGNMEVGIILKTDSSGMVSGVRLANQELNKLGNEAKKAGDGTSFLAKAAGAAGTAVGSVTRMVFSLQGALGGLSIGLIANDFLKAATTTENFTLRLEALLGSGYEANRMFEDMSVFASKVPFEYEQIMASATKLAGVMKGGVDEVNQWMPMIADLAAVSGLSIEQTSDQIIRMYSAGANSADLFRERGILAMLGFEAGVEISAEETKKHLLGIYDEASWKGATDKMAATWDGMMSMMRDSWFQFEQEIMKSGVYDYLKAALGTALDSFREATGSAAQDAEAMADQIIAVLNEIIIRAAYVGDAFRGWQAIFLLVDRGVQVLTTYLLGYQRDLLQMQLVVMEGWNLMARAMGQTALVIDTSGLKEQINLVGKGINDAATNADKLKAQFDELAAKKLPSESAKELTENLNAAVQSARVFAQMAEDDRFMMEETNRAAKNLNNTVGEESKKAYEKRMKAVDSALEKTLDALKTEEEKTLEWYLDSVIALENALEAKRLSEADYYAWRERLEKETQDKLAEIAKKGTKEQTDEFKAIWEETQKGLRSAFVDFYKGIFTDGVDSFGDLWDAVKKLFLNMLAEMLAAWTLQFLAPVLQGIPLIGDLFSKTLGTAVSSMTGGSSTLTSTLGSAASDALGLSSGAGASAIGGTLGTVGGTAGAALAGSMFGATSPIAAEAAFATMGGATSAWTATTSGIPGLTWAAEGATGTAATAGAAGEAAGSSFLSGLSETVSSGIETVGSTISEGLSSSFLAGAGAFYLGAGAVLVDAFIGSLHSVSDDVRDEFSAMAEQVGGPEGLGALTTEIEGLTNAGEASIKMLANSATGIGGVYLKVSGDINSTTAAIEQLGLTHRVQTLTAVEDIERLGGQYILFGGTVEEINVALATSWGEAFSYLVETGAYSYDQIAAFANASFADQEAAAMAFALVYEDGVVTAAEAAALGITIMEDMTVEAFKTMITEAVYLEEQISTIMDTATAAGAALNAMAGAGESAAAAGAAATSSGSTASASTGSAPGVPLYGEGGFVSAPHLAVVGDTPEYIIPAPFGNIPVQMLGAGGNDNATANAIADLHGTLIEIEDSRTSRERRRDAEMGRLIGAVERLAKARPPVAIQ